MPRNSPKTLPTERGGTPAGEASLYREFFERSADAILIIEGDTFIDCNEATLRMLGYRDKDELLQTHPSMLSPEFQPDGRSSYRKANEMIAIAFEKGSHRFEWEHLRADGQVFPVEVLLTSVPHGDRFLLHVGWCDITERKRLESELRHAQKMEAIGKLAGGIAHDFNNLLMAIFGYSDLLSRSLEDQPRLHRQAQEIHKAASRASDLTSQLLAFGRKQTLRNEIVDLNSVLRALDRMLQVVMGESIQIQYEFSDDPVIVRVDPGQIQQVVLNICTNSKDAMGGGGTLRLSTERIQLDKTEGLRISRGSYVSLRITDSGSGMTQDAVDHAFDPFFTTKARGHGTGLGLASVYGIVTQSHGDVRIQSTPGEGTTLEVLLPCCEGTPTSNKESSDKAEPQRAAGESILVAEDDATVSRIVCSILEEAGYRVRCASSGADAAALASQESPIDLLLTDVIMPAMGGPDLVRKLREDRPDLPALFMSGYTDDALSEQGFAIDDIPLIRKPFSATELLARISEALSEGRRKGTHS